MHTCRCVGCVDQVFTVVLWRLLYIVLDLHSIYSPITNLRALGVADRHLLTAHPLDTIWLGAQQFMIQRCLGTLVMASVTQQIRCTSLASLCTAFMRM